MEWQWHQLDHMQIICTLLQRDNHASTSPLSFTGRCPSCRPTNSVKKLKANSEHINDDIIDYHNDDDSDNTHQL